MGRREEGDAGVADALAGDVGRHAPELAREETHREGDRLLEGGKPLVLVQPRAEHDLVARPLGHPEHDVRARRCEQALGRVLGRGVVDRPLHVGRDVAVALFGHGGEERSLVLEVPVDRAVVHAHAARELSERERLDAAFVEDAHCLLHEGVSQIPVVVARARLGSHSSPVSIARTAASDRRRTPKIIMAKRSSLVRPFL